MSRDVRHLVLGLVFGLVGIAGCDPATEEATGAKPQHRVPGVVRLPPEEATRAGILTSPVVRTEFRTYRDFPGTVVPNAHAVAEITTLVRGRVTDVYVDLGQEVKGGSLLAILYSSDLGMAQSAYLKANAKLYVAERAYQRAKSLLEEKVIGVAELQRREGEMISTRAEAREARDRLRLLGMDEEAIRRLDRDQKILSYVPIEAPFEGRIIARNITKGEVVETTEKLFTVADLSEVWVHANIPEKDIPFIYANERPVENAEVRVSSYPGDVFQGKVTYVGDVLEPSTRTLRLRLELPNRHRKLKPEMYATVRIHSKPESDVLAIPESAVQRDKDRHFVFVQRDGDSFEVREVTLGESNSELVKVLSGLREGEPVVTTGSFLLKSELLGEQI
jgi:cobalt-zinc-cadmium efflux system membrane fusion protein